jgi:hypothetical protein
MAKLANKLKTQLEKKIEYPCEVWFTRAYPYGWIMKTDQTCPQRIGYNYKQASEFIKNFDWDWIKNHHAKKTKKAG